MPNAFIIHWNKEEAEEAAAELPQSSRRMVWVDGRAVGVNIAGLPRGEEIRRRLTTPLVAA